MTHIPSKKAEFLAKLAQTNDIPLMLEVDHAEGCFIWDTEGKKYIDLISGIGVSALGHANKAVIDAIKAQVDRHMHVMVYGEFIQNPQVEYASWLSERLHESLGTVYFTNSGAEATEGAMKLARRYTGRYKMGACHNAYHGSTQGALSLAGGEWLKAGYRPLLPNIFHIPFNDEAALDMIDEETACFIVEPIQAEAGTVVPDDGYLKALKKRCSDTGTLLIFDEIQTGFGRTGPLFAHEAFEVVPDILLLGKALGGGMPLGAFIADQEIMKCLSHDPVLGHITTFGGHPVSCAAGLAFAQELERLNLSSKVHHLERAFREAMGDHIVNGKGLLLSIEMGNFEKVQKAMKYAVLNGVITDWFLFNDHSIRIAPPLVISEEVLTEAALIIKSGLKT